MPLTDDEKLELIDKRKKQALVWTFHQFENPHLWLMVRDGTRGQLVLNWIQQFPWMVLSDARGNIHHDEYWLADDVKWAVIHGEMIYASSVVYERLHFTQPSIDGPNDLQSRFHTLRRTNETGAPIKLGWLLEPVSAETLPAFNKIDIDNFRILREVLGFGGTFKGETI